MRQTSAAIVVRDYRPEDVDALMDLFRTAVLQVARRDYTEAQVRAWAGRMDREHWLKRLAAKPTFIAEVSGQIAGFSDLEPDGHIDMLFVHADHQGRGVAAALFDHILARAKAAGLGRLYTEASLTARPFFERRGFTLIAAQDVPVAGEVLRNFRMELAL
ncbi:GNAT family N-acetyltransferase [Archangium minus]|uniref:GNAT family N-acetyltransferase n=1 Tax=Archangium minus TaxID=83450 RepID=A0ABY9WNY1_9BACT|nr:GNAT family N-acetyltransferase [Archangium minus]